MEIECVLGKLWGGGMTCKNKLGVCGTLTIEGKHLYRNSTPMKVANWFLTVFLRGLKPSTAQFLFPEAPLLVIEKLGCILEVVRSRTNRHQATHSMGSTVRTVMVLLCFGQIFVWFLFCHITLLIIWFQLGFLQIREMSEFSNRNNKQD